MISRRMFLATGAAAFAGRLLGAESPAPRTSLKKAVNLGMAGGVKGTLEEKFKAIREAGFEGVELNLPDDEWDVEGIQKAKAASGLEIAGVICTTHWASPLSDPKPEVRERTVRALQFALKHGGELGAPSVLLVPGKVTREVSYEECWRRSIEGIRRCVEAAEASRCVIAIENVWNLFITNPAEAVRYVDEINSPWVRWHFDIGNAVTYGWPEQWIRSLGARIGNLHFKEYSRAKRDKGGPFAGFNVELGEPWLTAPEKDDGVNWASVMKALAEVKYSGWAILEVGGGDAGRLKFLAERTAKLLQAS